MKRTVILIGMFVLCSFTSKFGEYCDGFKIGYKKGYCYGKYSCVPPVPPVCPVRRVGEKDTFDDGYNRGFLEGNNDAK